MKEWKHELGRKEYELLVDGLCRASVVANMLEDLAEDLDPPTIKKFAATLKIWLSECLAFGQFDESDIIKISASVTERMFPRLDS